MSGQDVLAPGLRVALEGVGVHRHLCAIYQRPEEQLAAAAVFGRIALERGGRCICISPRPRADLLGALRAEGVDVDAALASGRLSIADTPGRFFPDGVFDPIPDRLARLTRDTLDAGFPSLWLAADMSWALGPTPGMDRLAECEAQLNPLVESTRLALLCQYDRGRYPASVIRRMIATHPQVVVAETVCRNPFYVAPEDYLAPDWRDREIDWILKNLVQLQSSEDGLRHSEERHRRLSRRLLEVQEQERCAIARELHDQVGGDLLAVRMNIAAAASVVRVRAARAKLEEALALTDHATDKVRALAVDLRPAALEDLGLIAAAGRMVEERGERFGFRGTFSAAPGDARLPAAVENACFRILQEALLNVARHARALHVDVTLTTGAGATELVIRDDGVGFDPAALRALGRPQADLGLVGMEERAALAGGELKIESAPGAGTTIQVRFPVDENDAEA